MGYPVARPAAFPPQSPRAQALDIRPWQVPDTSASGTPSVKFVLKEAERSRSGSRPVFTSSDIKRLLEEDAATRLPPAQRWLDYYVDALRSFVRATPNEAHEENIAASTRAVNAARDLLEALWSEQLRPARVAPTVDGGVLLTIVGPEKATRIRALDDGDYWFSLGGGEGFAIEAGDREALTRAIGQIARSVLSGPPVSNAAQVSPS